MPVTQVPDKRTPVTILELWNAVLLDYELTGRSPTRRAVKLLLAQILGESAGKPHCYNLTNIKRGKSWTGDWCMFKCGEEIRASTLKAIEALGPGLVSVAAEYVKDKVPWLSIKIKPPHPWSHFRAYPDLRAGLAGKFSYLKSHPAVLEALHTGDLEVVNEALAKAGFYTAAKGTYLRMLRSRMREVERATKYLDWGDVI